MLAPDPEILRAQQFYSPEMIRRLLPGLPTRTFQVAPQQVLRDRVKGDRPRWSWDEEQRCIACDLEQALAALAAVGPLFARVVWRYGVLRNPDGTYDPEHNWTAIGRDEGWSMEVIKRAWFEGIGFLANHLGYEGDMRRWYDQGRRKRSGSVWRKELPDG